MIQSGIKLHPVFFPASVNLDPAQHVVPGLPGQPACRVEIQSGGFAFEIETCIFDGGVAQAGADFELFIRCRIEPQIQPVADAPGGVGARLDKAVYESPARFGRFTHPGDEVHLHPLAGVAEFDVFRVGFDPALHFDAVDHPGPGFCDIAALALLVTDVDNQVRRTAPGKGISVQPAARGGGEFGPDAVIVEEDAVIAGLRRFVFFGEP